jgi:hypothetical protein
MAWRRGGSEEGREVVVDRFLDELEHGGAGAFAAAVVGLDELIGPAAGSCTRHTSRHYAFISSKSMHPN